MVRAVIVLLVAAAVAPASAGRIAATVAATRSRSVGADVVTESDVVFADGRTITVQQLGGVIDGVGVRYTHQPTLLRAGDAVALELAGDVVIGVGATMAQVAPGTASYGVQRTNSSDRPLWRDSGCIGMVYDTNTVPAKYVDTLDAGFAAWTTATHGCAELSFTRELMPYASATRDGISTLHVRSDAWPYAPEATAVTRLAFIDIPGDPDDGKILDADMEINAVSFTLAIPSEMTPGAIDLAGVITHEAGHVLGLAHDCGTGNEPWPRDLAGNAVPACDGLAADSPTLTATMYVSLAPGDTSKRTLESADTGGACKLTSGAVCTVADYDADTGCSSGRGGGWLAALLLGRACSSRRRPSPTQIRRT
jgi:hypothetical protein